MWMSDESFSPTVFRCLPASVAMQMTDTGIVPQGSQAALTRPVHHLKSFMRMATTDFMFLRTQMLLGPLPHDRGAH